MHNNNSLINLASFTLDSHELFQRKSPHTKNAKATEFSVPTHDATGEVDVKSSEIPSTQDTNEKVGAKQNNIIALFQLTPLSQSSK